jgi:predicted RNA methylase
MLHAFEASDQDGAWIWKDAYEASEAAAVLFLRKYGRSLIGRAGNAARALGLLEKISALLPSHTRRSEESEQFQQFSTPLGLGFLMAHAAQIPSGTLVLEPSAGTGLLAIHAEIAGASLALNELADTRRGLLASLFPASPVTQFNAEQIDDYLDPVQSPATVLMNPPFSASPGVERTMRDATQRHIHSALRRLALGGRLAVLTHANHDPEAGSIVPGNSHLSPGVNFTFTTTIGGRVYSRHGTSVDTRLTIYDRVPDNAPMVIAGHAESLGDLLRLIETKLPPRAPSSFPAPPAPAAKRPAPTNGRGKASLNRPSFVPAKLGTALDAEELGYEPREVSASDTNFSDRIYEPYEVQTIAIAGAKPHPTKLVQSAAMASVRAPLPNYRPLLPSRLVTKCILSDAQLETIIYAGEAHAELLSGWYRVDESLDNLSLANDVDVDAVQFRKGFFLGDGTGAGKGRQAAGILLDNWLRGRKKAVWISKSDKLIEDAQRDWSALGQEKLLIAPQSRYRQGTPIRLSQGILFTTYATLRSSERDGKSSRLQQMLDWLGPNFEGVILFDEAHAMANAAGEEGQRGERRPRSRAAQASGSSMPCPTPASSTSPRRVPRPCTIWLMRSASGFGAGPIFPSQTAPILWPLSRRAGSPPWKCLPAT